ncbi:alpha/beta fold hydrolase [Chelatococcus sambhunathii]|uniref:Alpha/beta fold hydrolase n=1 Tax=Chelatococcus sambhunathii TaxID=363953 RepID=A0ABU1DBK6_9HYPH|nr:alpha/beta fold hydrolase [Chelatococcus sambhunathii]MDR4305491.1 alpha/beta fold hydrolase [Chelatococcus sambhunathii]
MKGVIVKLLLVAVALYGLVCLAMFAGQKRFLFHPTPATAKPAAYGLADFRRVTIPTSDGLKLVGWLHEGAAPDRALIYFYGNADALPPYAPFFRRFADAGYAVLGVNYRGYAGSDGEPSEEGFYRDGEAALRFMAERVPVGAITVMGRSIGSGVAVKLAAENPVGAVVLISPYTSITNVAAKAFWWLPVRLLLTHRFPSIERIGAVRAPLLIVHGARDTLIPPSEGEALFAAANEPKRLEIQHDADHIALDFDRIFELATAPPAR